MPDLEDVTNPIIEMVDLDWLKEAKNNNKNHTPESVAKLARSMAEIGQITPVVCDKEGIIIAGHGRARAARQLGWSKVKCHILPVDHDTARRMRIADNLQVNQDYLQDALLSELRDLALDEDQMKILINDDRMLDNLKIALDPVATMSKDSIVDDLDEAVDDFARETDDLMSEVEERDVPLKQIFGVTAVKPREARRLNLFLALLQGRHGRDNGRDNLMAHIEEELANG